MKKSAVATSLVPLAHGTQHGCFGCGDGNRTGLRLKFFATPEVRVVCRFRLAQRFVGPPGYAHGGIIATLLDEAMSKANRRRNMYAMTRHMAVDYLRPVPLETTLLLEGASDHGGGRKHQCQAELRDLTGRVLARSSGLFIEVRPERLLHPRNESSSARESTGVAAKLES